MKQTFYKSLFILLFISVHYAQTLNTKDSPLSMDQAYLTISNKNYTDAIKFMYNIVVCEKCDFTQFADPILTNQNQTKTIDTRYPYDFHIFSHKNNATFICQIESYQFSEHGSYLFEVTQINTNDISCSIHQTKDSSYYYTPIIIGVSLLFAFVLLIQLWHRFYNSRLIARILTNAGYQRFTNVEYTDSTDRGEPTRINAAHNEDVFGAMNPNRELSLVGSTVPSNSSVKIRKVLPKRLRALDTFRGLSLMVMIFVNYGGGGYWFYDHSVWNGLTLADLVFPWFVWMMGVSIVLSQRSLLKKKITKQSIFLKICRRTFILFLLGLILQGGHGKPKDVRILGVLQRLALCYFFTAILVLIFDYNEDELNSSEWPIGDDVDQPLRTEIKNTIFQFWAQWVCVVLITVTWILVTFVPKLSNCPRGYVGPGGKHEHGMYENCTGGVAGYIDRVVLGPSHIFNYPTCRDVYGTKIPYDPEGLLGILTGILLCYLGVQAGHTFAYSTRVRRVCTQWIILGIICGAIGLILSKGGHSESWIPINKNLWSLSFVLVLSGFAFVILAILYLLIDVYKLFTGEPWLWLGMNSIVIYVGHDICSESFPIQFEVNQTHTELLALHAWGVTFWMIVAGLLYYNKKFIAI